MSMIHAHDPTGAPAAGEARTRRVWPWITGLLVAVAVCGSVTLFAWMIDETHFDRPSDRFDELTAQIEHLPGVSEVQQERWVEAPLFADPTSWVELTVDEHGLGGLLEAACAMEYPDAVRWSLTVRTDRATEVSLHGDSASEERAAGTGRCPDFGLDVAPLVAAIDRVAPGLALQPAVWENDRFAIVEIDQPSDGFSRLLPLVAHADDLLHAAGLDPDQSVDIDGPTLSVSVEAGESDRYVVLLSELAQNDVSNFWAGAEGTQADGIDKVQVVAPERQHAAIEEAVRMSRLGIADRPVRFLTL